MLVEGGQANAGECRAPSGNEKFAFLYGRF
jgi:hypothetical protein